MAPPPLTREPEARRRRGHAHRRTCAEGHERERARWWRWRNGAASRAPHAWSEFRASGGCRCCAAAPPSTRIWARGSRPYSAAAAPDNRGRARWRRGGARDRVGRARATAVRSSCDGGLLMARAFFHAPTRWRYIGGGTSVALHRWRYIGGVTSVALHRWRYIGGASSSAHHHLPVPPATDARYKCDMESQALHT